MDKRDYGKRLANAIATQMRRKGITQEQLGSMIGVSQRTISDYASGKTRALLRCDGENGSHSGNQPG